MFCLRLLQDGATGETQAAMAKVLEVAGLEPEALQSTTAALRSALQVGRSGLQVEAANSIWCNQGWEPSSEYTAKVKKNYDAEVMVLDFHDPGTVARINSWVSGKTHGKIDSILNSLDPLAFLLIINAVYFKDLWDRPFNRQLTREESFHMSDGRKVKLPLMSQSDSYCYYEEPTFQAVRVGYKTPRLAMYIFLPRNRSNLQQFEQNLSSAAWDKWTGSFETAEGHLRLPRFKLTHGATLNSALDKLGMGIAFDSRRARFDAINPTSLPIWVDKVLHRAFVEVNEEGTEAAAVTTVLMASCALKPCKPCRTFNMIVDRPFFFAIRDDDTKTILFMGAVEEPDAKNCFPEREN